MKSCLVLNCFKFRPPHTTRYERIYAPANALYSQKHDILAITAYCVL